MKENSNMNPMANEEITIDLVEIAGLLLSKIKMIIFWTLLGAVIVNGATYLTVDPTYQSTSTLYVVSASGGGVVDLTDLNIGSDLKNDYNVLIQRYPVLSRTIRELELDMKPEELQGMISIDNPTDTRILTLTVTSTDRYMARDIANKLAEISTEYLPDVMNADAPNIAERARLADHKSGPSFSKATLIGGLLGLILSCLYFIIMFMMDNMVRTDEDVEKLFGEMPLASIPYSAAMDTESAEYETEEAEAADGRMCISLPKLPYAAEEAISRLRVNMTFSGENVKSIMVTSSVANEGKSHVAVNLWRSMAEAGIKTVLVDLDIRNSVLKNMLTYAGQEEYKGIDYFLSGKAEYEEILYETNIENGYIVPCTHTLLNPSSLLHEEKMSGLIKRLRDEFEYVIIDTAPILIVADGELISNMCDGAVMVVRSGRVSNDEVRRSIATFDRNSCQMLGSVLNGVDVETKKYGRYGRYGRYGHYGHYGHYGRYGEYGGYGKDS